MYKNDDIKTILVFLGINEKIDRQRLYIGSRHTVIETRRGAATPLTINK